MGRAHSYFSPLFLNFDVLLLLLYRMPSFGVTVRSSQADLARSKVPIAGKAGIVASNITSDASVDGWDAIALEYSVDWPMQLFFTQEVLSK